MGNLMRSYVKPILAGNVELDITPYTLGQQVHFKQMVSEINLPIPPDNADYLEVDMYMAMQTCCMFFVLCEDLRIIGDLDIPELDMLNAFWSASANMNAVERWEMWQTHISLNVGQAIRRVVLEPVDDRLLAPPELQSTEKKSQNGTNHRVPSAMP